LRIAGLILPDDGQISSIVAFDDEPIEHRIHARQKSKFASRSNTV